MGKLTFVDEQGKQEVNYSRVFDAPRETVFKAYTDPKLKPQWWGLKRNETIVDKAEVKMGGIWRYISRDPGGLELAFHGVYHEVKAPERLVNTLEFEMAPGLVSLDTLIFKEEGGATKLAGKSVFQSVADRDVMIGFGMMTVLAESFDRLEELLVKSKVPADR